VRAWFSFNREKFQVTNSRGVRIPSSLLIYFKLQIQYTMKMYAVIHGVCGLYEGYSDTTCDWFPTKEAAQKHIDQCLEAYRDDDMCVNIDHDDHMPASTYVTMTNDPDDYKACVPEDMDHDDWVAENDASVEVFRIVEVDVSRYEGSGTTEHMWLTWDQQDCSVAWDYNPLCMSLVARVSSDVMDNTSDVGHYQGHHNLEQLNEFISSVYYRNHAFIDVDDYSMHAFRIPKKLKSND